MTPKPMLMILGSYHMANPGRDMVNVEADDVMTPKRQIEIKQLVGRLKKFKPTKVAVEHESEKDVELQTTYRSYLNGNYQLRRNETQQIGFRLAQQMGHRHIYPVDWNKLPPVDLATVDFQTFAKANNQQTLLDEILSEHPSQATKEAKDPEKRSVIDIYRSMNQDENIRKDHQVYFTIARIGKNDQYVGADWVQYWYGRNLRIFVNLTRITESPDERILLIIGGGHVRLLQQFVSDSGYYILESPLKYLTEIEIT